MNKLEIKRNIFNIYENARILFNKYYNNYIFTDREYEESDTEEINKILNDIKDNIRELKENK